MALERQKIRKDYELMSTQLREILNNNELANSFVQVRLITTFQMKIYSKRFSISSIHLTVFLLTDQRFVI